MHWVDSTWNLIAFKYNITTIITIKTYKLVIVKLFDYISDPAKQ